MTTVRNSNDRGCILLARPRSKQTDRQTDHGGRQGKEEASDSASHHHLLLQMSPREAGNQGHPTTQGRTTTKLHTRYHLKSQT